MSSLLTSDWKSAIEMSPSFTSSKSRVSVFTLKKSTHIHTQRDLSFACLTKFQILCKQHCNGSMDLEPRTSLSCSNVNGLNIASQDLKLLFTDRAPSQELISTLKKKKVQAGNELPNLPPKSLPQGNGHHHQRIAQVVEHLTHDLKVTIISGRIIRRIFFSSVKSLHADAYSMSISPLRYCSGSWKTPVIL